MLAIPSALQSKFEERLRNESIPNNLKGQYKKWLQYYLDFCSKYHFPDSGFRGHNTNFYYLWLAGHPDINFNNPPRIFSLGCSDPFFTLGPYALKVIHIESQHPINYRLLCCLHNQRIIYRPPGDAKIAHALYGRKIIRRRK